MTDQGIEVTLVRPTAEGRLYPRYDQETNILEVGSRVRREWPFGIDIDGRVIFDADSRRIVANFDLLVPRRLWHVAEPFGGLPQPAQRNDLQLAQTTVIRKSFSLPLTVTTNAQRSQVFIRFGDMTKPLATELSPACIALVEEGRLVGFFIRLE